ncbi:AAA family ATPase [Mesorhizobium sp.]|uniref:AAA family ATPase n=1 Tax=Mesorhizobium sp. TaxID=1871066 RepID=UPI0025CF372A|nr:AAA family ATPase [Mesorhizobium sp.]
MTEQIKAAAEAEPLHPVGPLELAVYGTDSRSAHIYRSRTKARASQAELRASGDGVVQPIDERREAGEATLGSDRPKGGFSTLGRLQRDEEDEEDAPVGDGAVEAPTPGRIAARLMLAGLFDRDPGVLAAFASAAPVIIVEVPDEAMHVRIARQWKDVLDLDYLRFKKMKDLTDLTSREDCDAIEFVSADPIQSKERRAADDRAFTAVQLALPIIAIVPAAEGYLSKVLIDAATHRLTLPKMSATIIERVVRIVTGRRAAVALPADAAARVGMHELLLAVRFDRSADECVANLLRAVEAKVAKAGSRDLSLDQLHGLDEAVEWAKSTKLDIEAWKRNDISWDAIDAGIVLDGPPGTGKTLFAKLAAEFFGLPLVAVTLAKWQGSGEGHLGHLLRAMRKDFEDARARSTGAVFFCDELDSFADRATITHNHKDYVVEVINAFIEQLDGLQGRRGLIFIGATNDVSRCDPAIVRAGRLNRIVRIGLPSPDDIEKIMRVRLRGDLKHEAIGELCLLAQGSSGADIERVVKDARRFARQEGRALRISDLRRAVLGGDDVLSDELLARVAAHEAGHILVAVLDGGPKDIHAVVANRAGSAGFVAAKGRQPEAGTLAEYRKVLQALLAGRAAEELLCGAAGAGSGGARESDLAMATRIAAALVGSLGHAGPHPLLFVAERHRTDAILDSAYMRAAVHQELAAAFDEVKRVLGSRRTALEQVALRLRSRLRIDGFEVAEILKRSEAVGSSRTGGPP